MARDPAKLKGRVVQLNLSALKNRRGPAGFYRGQVVHVTTAKRGTILRHVTIRLSGGVGQKYTGRRVTKVTPGMRAIFAS